MISKTFFNEVNPEIEMNRGSIIPFYQDWKKQKIFIFAIDYYSDKIGDFGGSIEKGEKWFEGALREYREESYNLLPPISKEDLISKNSPVIINGKKITIIHDLGKQSSKKMMNISSLIELKFREILEKEDPLVELETTGIFFVIADVLKKYIINNNPMPKMFYPVTWKVLEYAAKENLF